MHVHTSDTPAAPIATILVVDDALTFRTVLEQVLITAGYAVVTAADGKEVRHIAYSIPLALVLLDRVLPTVDGVATARQLRSDAYTADIPLVLMSAAAPADVSLFRAFLPKPFTFDALITCVQQYHRIPVRHEGRRMLPERS